MGKEPARIEEPARIDQLIADIAARQHGILTAGQLHAVGLGDAGISRRRRAGRLHRIHRGVYAVGHPRLTFEGRCLAAVLACGPVQDPIIAAVSHRAAARLWGLLSHPEGPIDVSVASRNGRERRAGIVIHRSSNICSEDLTRRFGIPVTNPARTLRDLPRVVSEAGCQRAVRKAVDLGLVSEDDALRPEDLTRSELERLFLRLCRRRRLPAPEVNARVGRWEVDFLWRRESVIVETDGFRHHGGRLAFERDRQRDAQLHARGFRVLRFSYLQVKESPGLVAGTLRTVLRSSTAV